jgi:hypothetical protein
MPIELDCLLSCTQARLFVCQPAGVYPPAMQNLQVHQAVPRTDAWIKVINTHSMKTGHHQTNWFSAWGRSRTLVAAACLLYAAHRYIMLDSGHHDVLTVPDSSEDAATWLRIQHAHAALPRRVLVATNETHTATSSNSQSSSTRHKDLVPLALADWLTFAAAAIILLLAAGGGIGGGVVMVPLFILVTGAHHDMHVEP